MLKNNKIVDRLHEFMNNEARSCSMDFGCVTAEYVFRSWGGTVAIEDIREYLSKMELPTK